MTAIILGGWGGWAWLAVWAAVFAVVGLFLVTLFVTSLVETHDVVTFGTAPWDAGRPLDRYAEAMNAAAGARQFYFGGTYGHVKGGTYQVSGSMWLSGDRQVLAVVSAGRMAKIRSRKTVLWSVLTDGTQVVSSDESGIGHPTPRVRRAFLLNAGFDELLAFHEQRVRVAGVPVAPLPEGGPADLMRALDTERAADLVRNGYARYRDANGERWSYSLEGAWWVVAVNLKRQMAESSAQRERQKVKRPGD